MSGLTHLLSAAGQGDPRAAEQLLPLVYAELRRLAARWMTRERPGQTLDATALVHEAFLRLVGQGGEPSWKGRGHFFAAAAEAMRRILVERARRKLGPTRGGDWRRVDADLDALSAPLPPADLLALNDALTKLAAESPARAELVKLRFFAGLTVAEAAAALDISVATAERHWTYARAWLGAELAGPENSV